MPSTSTPPDSATQGYMFDVVFVDRLPGDRAFILLADRRGAACFAVKERFTPLAREHARRDAENLARLGLWPLPPQQPQATPDGHTTR